MRKQSYRLTVVLNNKRKHFHGIQHLYLESLYPYFRGMQVYKFFKFITLTNTYFCVEQTLIWCGITMSTRIPTPYTLNNDAYFTLFICNTTLCVCVYVWERQDARQTHLYINCPYSALRCLLRNLFAS